MEKEIEEMLRENARRHKAMSAPFFDPISGRGSLGRRVKTVIATPEGRCTLWLPRPMLAEAPIRAMLKSGEALQGEQAELFERTRLRHDFPYWAAKYVAIKRKGGGDDCPLVLTHPQRILAESFERQRLAGKPIRTVLLKARQWGGSTVTQMYMAWLQLVHERNLNSLIIAHQATCSDEIKEMYDRMIGRYPRHLLFAPGEPDDGKEPKIKGCGTSRNTWRVAGRNARIKLGSAERPDSCRGGDYNLVHLSEVGLWRATDGKKPEDIVRSACSGILYDPRTMIVYESTANGVGNFFHREYIDARDNPDSHFTSVFIAWHQIEQNSIPFPTPAARAAFAASLIGRREAAESPSRRQESGSYLWLLWQKGATLEGINWYITERAKHSDHGSMAAECPSDDTEAFVNSGAAVFDKYKVEALRAGCRPPRWIGEVAATRSSRSMPGRFDAAALEKAAFAEDAAGGLWVWAMPDDGREGDIAERYLTVVDIGGRSAKSDWSVVAVFDRAPLMSGGSPEIVAQWRGHIDMDLLAWKAALIASFYRRSLLVIESNTLETHDEDRAVDGDQSGFILNKLARAYDRLYARPQPPEDVEQGVPRKYGFHTNVSTKPAAISTLVEAVRDRLYAERDERCLDEMLTYERRQNGSYGAIAGAHDDMLMTRAIGLYISINEMECPAPRAARQKYARDTFWT